MCTCGADCKGHRFLYYNNDTPNMYSANKQVDLDSLCNGYFVNNTGTTTCWVNGMPLQPGQSYTSGGNAGEIFTRRFVDIKFSGAGTNQAWVQQKFYVQGPGYDN